MGTELELTAKIVPAYLARSQVPPEALDSTIRTVHAALRALGPAMTETVPPRAPAVPIDQSVRPDYLVCLENGRRLRSLKRHLRVAHGLTPEEYRARWGLPPDYPMVAPNYAKRRSQLAKQIGLGTGGRGRGRKAKS